MRLYSCSFGFKVYEEECGEIMECPFPGEESEENMKIQRVLNLDDIILEN